MKMTKMVNTNCWGSLPVNLLFLFQNMHAQFLNFLYTIYQTVPFGNIEGVE
jgi:hypothetical protein